MAVLEPLKVTIKNLPSDAPTEVSVPNFPADESKGFHKVPITDVIFIEKSDFKEVSLGFELSINSFVVFNQCLIFYDNLLI